MILVIGATSGMIKSTLRNFAKDNKDFILLARDGDKLRAIENDLKVYGAKQVVCIPFEATNIDQANFDSIVQKHNVTDFLIAYGFLGVQSDYEKSFKKELDNYNINFISVAKWLNYIANYMEGKSGTVSVITSVAGERGRKANYVYGAGKAALICLLSGLRQRFARTDVAIIEIRPGFIDTPMTRDLKKGLLFCGAEKAGDIIYYAIKKRKNIVYVPGFWRYIMFVIKMIPEGIFKLLKF